MLITSYVLEVSEHDSSEKWLTNTESITDRLSPLPKYEHSEESFTKEVTMLRVYQESLNFEF